MGLGKIPGTRIERERRNLSITVKKDGRTILSGQDYSNLRMRAFDNYSGHCARCHSWIWFASFHLHHKRGRGLGGGKRNDILSEVEPLCSACHRKEHNQ